MQWISSIFCKCYKLNSSISEKCWKFIASKMLEIKSWHLTWGGPMILGLLLHCNKRKIVKIRGVDDHTYIDCTLYNNAYNISLVWISIKKYIYRQCLLVVIEKEVSKDCHKSTFLIRVIINHRPTLLKWRVRIAYYTSEHLAVILLFFMQQIFFWHL